MDFSKCKSYGIELIEHAHPKCANCICSVCSIAQSNGGSSGCGNCNECNGKDPCNSCREFYFPLRPRPFETEDHLV